MNAVPPVTPERLMQLAWGYAPPLIIAAADRCHVFGLLGEEARSLPQLAAASGASERGLRAILNALVGLGLLQRRNDSYCLTAESEAFLVPGRPGYRGSFFHHHVDQLLPQWLDLEEVVRTGRPAAATNRVADGESHFVGFVEALFPGGYPAAQILGKVLGIPEATGPVSVLDIGAGSGVWGIALAEQSPHVRVRAVDWPRVLEITRQIAGCHGVEQQLTSVPGDLFEADFGQGHQVAILGHILHSEGPARSRRLLDKTLQALAPGGTVAIQEFVPHDDRSGPLLPLLFAVNMLVNTECGDTYTLAELREWLTDSGFVRVRQVEVPAVSPLILADRPMAAGGETGYPARTRSDTNGCAV